MAAVMPPTPHRPLPGAYLNTPALQRQSSFGAPSQPSIFRSSSAPQPQMNGQGMTGQWQTPSYPRLPPQDTPNRKPERGGKSSANAARTLNATLDEDSRYPPVDSYIGQGSSSDYDIPSSAAWAPFQKVKMYDIPDQIFEHYNRAQVSTMMGLFADINHAWISIDNSLYLWDYTHPYPELQGFEEQPNSITAVKLAFPRPGVFLPTITRLLVVATTSDMFILGVSCDATASGAKSVSLYQTRMQVPVRGVSVESIACSAKSGRIFFAGRADEDIHELTYQQEEKWFQSRCTKVNQTRKGYQSVVPMLPFGQKPPYEFVTQLVIDDTRDILYSLSSRSTIRVFSLQNHSALIQSLSQSQPAIMSDIAHRVGVNHPLLQKDTQIVSIDPIIATEASRLNLVATTSRGCRIFFSSFSGGYFSSDSKSPLTSMQVHHVRFPPRDPSDPTATSTTPQAPAITYTGQQNIPASNSLTKTRMSRRFPPGYFLCFVQRSPQAANDTLFISAPDTGRIAHPQDQSQTNRFPESGYWFGLEGQAEDVGLVTPPFSASSVPTGFGNELAVQFDHPSAEVAVLTNSGIHTYRRRRLVDVFAAALRYGGGDEGLDGAIRNFVRSYGRSEMIATALAVACGQASDVTSDSRVAKVTDPELLEYARRAFIEHGGKPMLNENSVIDQSASLIDNVRPSPRHDGLASYISRLLRSVWRVQILREGHNVAGGLQISPAVALPKLQAVQRDLIRLQEFLSSNRTFIEGLAGPDALGRVSTKQEEVALQGEHAALNSILCLISDVVEGIAFVLVLFDERVEDIFLSLPDVNRQQARSMTFERFFCTTEGKDLAKELVKGIVNWNIARGSNVDTVTDALRRRCGSFCSADDCVIFKAQEQLKRASDTDSSSEASRNLLNESLRLLQKVAESLSLEQLRWAIDQYVSMSFYAGAIQLALHVAQENDRGNRALSWLNEGSPRQDNRAMLYETRTKCYDFVHQIIVAVDHSSSQAPEMVDGHYTVTAKRKREAYDVVNSSPDELFQINLYDWYLSQGWSDRILDVQSSFAVSYLQRKSEEDVSKADLLWRYYAHYHNYIEAAQVQLGLAKSSFNLSLDRRIEYLGFARANASARTVGLSELSGSRRSRQEVMREVSDLLEIANIQEDLIEHLGADVRLSGDRKGGVLSRLQGQIQPLNDLYNDFADQAGYYDICLLIYRAANHHNPKDVENTWINYLDIIVSNTSQDEAQLSEVIAVRVQGLGVKLGQNELLFPIPTLLPLLWRKAIEYRHRFAFPEHWAVSIFLSGTEEPKYSDIVSTLESLFYSEEQPFRGKNHTAIASDLLYVLRTWCDKTSPMGGKETFDGEDNALAVAETLRELLDSGGLQGPDSQKMREEAAILRQSADSAIRAHSMGDSVLSSGGSSSSTRASRNLRMASSLILH